MDQPLGPALSGHDKAKLKEKLDVLKREYSRTLAKLQRAQNAERIKRYVKKTIAEQNFLLSQERMQLDPSEPKEPKPLSGESDLGAPQTESSLGSETKKKNSVSFKLEPQLFRNEGGVPEGSTPGDDDVLKRLSCISGPEAKNELPENKLKWKKRALLYKERESSCRPRSQIDAGERWQEQGFALNDPESSGFRRNTFSNNGSGIQNSPSPSPEMGEGSVCTPKAKESERDVGGMPEEKVSLGVVAAPLWARFQSSDNQQLGDRPPEGLCDENESIPERSVEITSTSLLNLGDAEREFSSYPTYQKGNEEGSPAEQQPNTSDFPGDDVNGSSDLLSSKSPTQEELHHSRRCSGLPTGSPSDGEKLPEQEEPPSSCSSLEVPAAVTVSSLNSCTVLEGLLFPVEYYVRTTRRMSNCQRKLDLEAVIQSQLGISRRGLKCKGQPMNKNVDQPGQETDKRDAPLSDSQDDHVSSESPSQKSLSPTGESNLSAEPPKGSSHVLADKKQPCRQNKGKRKSWKAGVHAQAEGKPESCPEASSLCFRSTGCLDLDPTAAAAAHFHHDMLNLKKLSSSLTVSDFHLPDKEFGFLKLEKLKSSTKPTEPLKPGTGARRQGGAGESAILEDPSLKQVTDQKEKDLITQSEDCQPPVPNLRGQAEEKGQSSTVLLLTPPATVLPGTDGQPEAHIGTPVFPIVGATPGFASPTNCENIAPEIRGPDTSYTTSPPYLTTPVRPLENRSQGSSSASGMGNQLQDQGQSKGIVLGSGKRNDGGSGPKEETAPPIDSIVSQGSQIPGTYIQGSCQDPFEQAKRIEPVFNTCCESGKRCSLQLTSKLKNPSSSCSVDVSTVWWEVAGCKTLCILTASEATVSLWKPQDPREWEKVYTWQFTEIPVIQIVPLPDVCNLVCVALGNLEIREIKALLYSAEEKCLQQLRVKAGTIKAVAGLRHRRLVSSCGPLHCQQVELVIVSEAGRKENLSLMPPEETILAFAEVQGMQQALVGTTVMNNLVVWNLKTGQLLKKMSIGNSYPASICHKAYSDMGLLFVVLSHPHAQENESSGNPVFQMIAINPRTALSIGVMPYCLPHGQAGRILEGEVKGNCAAAVLNSGTIAVWDLFLGHCTALLPPNADGHWSLVRWSDMDSSLLAGQEDGSVFVYNCVEALPKGKQMNP
ncbi:partner and localizer of BRCA2 isoform X2 [Tachyglossus aculeatus]|uniref:partner and localizer of BRCA2 isoform X2 n=1 Tax=Tachyglossus aculeatus TaxID=9261 RepID=UPI0018F3B2E5|nr:partner and localizer of BRCA2 isoform X2 [Tachyglossus aculeatus]